jgi:hypothetical protein
MNSETFKSIYIALSFDGFGSISWHSVWVFSPVRRFSDTITCIISKYTNIYKAGVLIHVDR